VNNTLLSAIALGAITLLAIRRHIRRGENAAAARRPAAPKACPRCGAPLEADASTCSRCGVPLQLFELVLAQETTADAGDAEGGGPLRALVRSDLCVGCGACVTACPEPGALTMSGKLAMVDPSRCKGHAECVPACPMGAITVGRGSATNRVVVPRLDGNFETSVPGLYIVGELGGRALIKNAVNEGRVAAEHVVRVAKRRRNESLEAPGVTDVAIVGSGPSGLSAGLVAHKAGLKYVLLEQGTLAETVRKYPRHKILFAEPLTMPLYGDLWVSDSSKESLLAVWEGVIARTGLRVKTGKHVRQIKRERNWFILTTDDAIYRARAVVLALGRRGTPRRLGVPGEDLPTVFYDIAEMSDFAGRKVLVVGGGDSAIESAIGLANQEGTTVTLSYRGDAFNRLKDRNRERLDATVVARKLTVLLGSTVREIRRDVAVVDVAGTSTIVPCDDVIVRIGGEPSTVLLEQLGVQMVTKVLAPPERPGQAGTGDAA